MQPLIEKKNTEKQKRDISVNKHRQYMTKKNPYSSIEEYGLIIISSESYLNFFLSEYTKIQSSKQVNFQ